MRKILVNRAIILLCYITLGVLPAEAQLPAAVRRANVEKVLYSGSYFSFSITPYIDEKAKIVQSSGMYDPGATNMWGIELGGNYYINLNKNYSLIIGLHAGSAARNFTLYINKNDFNPVLERDINFHGALTKDYDFYLSAPVWFEKRWPAKNHNHWNADAGINVRYYPDDVFYTYDYGANDAGGNYTPVLNLQAEVSNNYKPWINYNIGGGYSLFLSNYNFVRINLLANFSNTKIVNGDYIITVTGKPQSTGIYSSNLSFIGLSINYIFTGANRRLLKLYERR